MQKHIIALLLVLASAQGLLARGPITARTRLIQGLRVSSDCLPASASSQLDVNNVRCLLHNGGDMWWDLVGDPRYEIPKGSNRHSMFASSLWIGGLDDAGQLRVAAQTYRQSGIDFWPGPLTGGPNGGQAATASETCEKFNEMFKINKTEIDAFRADWADGVLNNPENYPAVFNWPAIGSPKGLDRDNDGALLEAFRPDGSILYAAPFINVDNDPFTYSPENGDFPDIDGDQAIWWIINDKGNIHTETGGEPIGVEIHMLAFAFTTANAVNDMTFYKETVVNRSTQVLNQTYLGQWVDADLGKFNDDYVGCDTLRGLGFVYNADNDDDGPSGYGRNPPSSGVDFFQGPIADPNDGIDNDKDGLTDEPNETIIMSKFIYYNNDATLVGNPDVANHYYGYLTGFWKDGTPIVDNYTNGGDGNGYGARSPGPVTNFMFPGDPCSGSGWTENNADNPRNEDRRFLISAGAFTLQPGAVNEIIIGVVWARGFYNDQFGSVCELYAADDVAQALFDNNFELLDGPDAPELTVSEYDQELLLTWDYPEALRTVRNNYNESYRQSDPVLKAQGVADSVFEFQGYIVYQLKDGTVGPNELNDPDRARILSQSDIQDGVGTIVNRSTQRVEGLDVPLKVEEVMVQGKDEGIVRSVNVIQDLFADGSETRLVNYTTYYYAVIAYAYNDTASDGREFVPGNRFFQVVAAMPHPVDFERVGTVINSAYGDEIAITKIRGTGNGGNFVKVQPESEAAILANNQSSAIAYQPGSAPIQVKVIDPKLVQPRYYRLEVTGNKFVEAKIISQDTSSGLFIVDSIFSEWELYESSSEAGPFNLSYSAFYTKRNDGTGPRPAPLTGTERIIENRGISISVRDVEAAGDTLDPTTGVIGGTLTFDDPSKPWLTGLADNDDFASGVWNWIRDDASNTFKTETIYDKNRDFQSILGGRWGPFAMMRPFSNSAAGGNIAPGLVVGNPSNNRQIAPSRLINLANLPDVDIVFTSDITKWSRCVVVETSPNSSLGTGAWQLSAKYKSSVDQSGQPESATLPQDGGPYGMGWFPGYAIDVNTGQRLNVFFGESEWDKLNRGNDMQFNPTFSLGTNLDRVGGRHYVYVTNLPYDGCESIKDSLMNANYVGINSFSDAIFFPETGHNIGSSYRHVAWVGIPLSVNGYDASNPRAFPTAARVSLRVKQPFSLATEAPAFTFNTIDRAVTTGETQVAKDALEKVLVVPNPYYAYSSYETGQLDNIVKITNLPQQCRISIFTLNGHLVRQYTKDSDEPDQDWDLKNQAGVPVASGVYIIHVDANIGDQKLGEKIIKLFAVMRQIDLDNF
ncbi:MAG: T9SS type A sorting domain-containing protein [Bacteroidia bacterium]|nr:T9SS type A sorting domain-containing protein [Bacteroidia bacterium]